jgi:hypothetical protein
MSLTLHKILVNYYQCNGKGHGRVEGEICLLQVEGRAGELRLPTNLCDGEGHWRVEGKVFLLQVEVGWRAEVTH